MGRTTVLLLALMLFVVGAMHLLIREENMKPNLTEREVVEKTIRSSIAWAKDKDIDLLYEVIANDSNYTEVDPGNRVIKGFEDFRSNEAFWINKDFKAVGYEIRDLRIHFSEHGTVAWWYGELDDMNTWKGQPANWMNTRWTGVLEKREGEWKIVQMHFSFAQ